MSRIMKDLPRGTSVIDTTSGPTNIHVMGKGPMIIVVHGGPGFDHRYMVSALEFLQDHRTLIFYDQPGCGDTPVEETGATIPSLGHHLAALAEQLVEKNNFGLICHSWGSLIAAAACHELQQKGLGKIREGILINPTPLNRGGYEICRSNLLSRVPPETLVKAEKMVGSGVDGDGIMDMMLPYYYHQKPSSPLPTFPFRLNTYLAVNAALDDFDYSDNLACFQKMSVVHGESDFTTLELIDELIESTESLLTMPECGHFPFFEEKELFQKLVLQCLNVGVA